MSVKVEVFSSPGCSQCARAKAELRKIAEEFGGDRIQWRDVIAPVLTASDAR